MKKTIYSLPPLAAALQAVNKRYLKFLSDIETPQVGVDKLHRLTETQHDDKGRRYKGFDLLAEEDPLFSAFDGRRICHCRVCQQDVATENAREKCRTNHPSVATIAGAWLDKAREQMLSLLPHRFWTASVSDGPQVA